MKHLYETDFLINQVPPEYIASWLGISMRLFYSIKKKLKEEFAAKGLGHLIT